MQTKIQAKVSLLMEIGEDCVVFAGRCLCHSIRENGLIMAAEAIVARKRKVVVVGDCDDHYSKHEEILSKVMQDAGLEHIWLADDGLFIRHAMPNFSETAVSKFEDAKNFGKLRKLLDRVGRKAWDIKRKIERDSELLAKYPVVAMVQAIESHDHNKESDAWKSLFGSVVPDELVSSVHAVLLLNPVDNTGVIVTDSCEIPFTLAEPEYFNLDTLQGRGGEDDPSKEGYTKRAGSFRVKIDEGVPEISMYCYPGVWQIMAHPQLDTMDPRYRPMCYRVTKAAP